MHMMKSAFFLAIATITLVLSTDSHTEAAPATAATIPTGKTIALVSSSRFGLFLSGGGGVETVGVVAFTNIPIWSAPKAGTLRAGFIESVNFERNMAKKYVQITGRFHRRTYGFSKHDQGRQYDWRSLPGAKCAGYPYFVQFFEPNEQVYCVRCCTHKQDCPTNRPTRGCREVIPGKY
ncbi:MAG: hypothetical protein J3R72DRAFT_444800 [Linnemannia gamsii]|nr:MAG: hypothetical protein J3R72DRAFT_444800 [Linnemannia gamsii]